MIRKDGMDAIQVVGTFECINTLHNEKQNECAAP
jgi:hypothetical protein